MCLWYSIRPSSSPAWLWGKHPPRIEPREPRTNALALSLLYHGFAPAWHLLTQLSVSAQPCDVISHQGWAIILAPQSLARWFPSPRIRDVSPMSTDSMARPGSMLALSLNTPWLIHYTLKTFWHNKWIYDLYPYNYLFHIFLKIILTTIYIFLKAKHIFASGIAPAQKFNWSQWS